MNEPEQLPLDFIDAGADDNEPVKGITQGILRQWHDLIERLCSNAQDEEAASFLEL
jgi:hypothetical protein